MTTDHKHLTLIERAMLDLREAEQVGLMDPTPVDARSLVSAPLARVTPIRRWLRVAMSLAACVLLMVGLRSMITASDSPTVGAGRLTSNGYPTATFNTCFAGPGVGVSSACVGHDYDADGDVDLADFRSIQLAMVD